jgi:hypothetical protein
MMGGRFARLLLGGAFLVICSCGGSDVGTANGIESVTPAVLLPVAEGHIWETGLEGNFAECDLAVVGIYRKMDIVAFDYMGIYNYRLTIEPVGVLKGQLNRNFIYLQVHSPGMQGFGHEENFGKAFLLFLKEDEFNDGLFAEPSDFISAVKLPI